MTRPFTRTIFTVLFARAVFGQSAIFEVASVKPVLTWPPPSGVAGERGAGRGCPTSMKVDPGRVDFKCTTLAMLIGYAWRISPDRVSGPEWMMAVGSPRFDIAANLPQGASKSQVPEMFRSLLADRFKLVLHRATANLPVYALVVAKGELKIDKATPGAGSSSADPDPVSSRDGFYGTVQSRAMPNSAGSDSVTIMSNPRMGTVRQTGDPYRVQRWEAPEISFAGLADLLDNVAPLSLPVIDMTGLGGRYRLILEVSFKDLPGARDAMADTEETVLNAFNNGLLKLGLRLERRKGPVQTIVVDHVEKTPTEN